MKCFWIHPALPLLAVILFIGGCSSNKKELSGNAKINTWLVQQQMQLPDAEYEVDCPDVLLVTAPQIKELDGQEVAIRPDGKITLNLLGDLDVAGKTPAQITDEVRGLARKYYTKNLSDIAVVVKEFKSKQIFVFGQVDEPGIRPYTGHDTILAVLAETRLNDYAWPQKIIIVRPNEEAPDVKQKVTVDVKQMWETGQVQENFVLAPGDLIYVPPSPLAKVNFTMQKILGPVGGTMNLLTFAFRGTGL